MLTVHQEVSLEKVMDYYAEGFKLEKAKITGYEYFIDAHKRKVVFKLYIVEDVEV